MEKGKSKAKYYKRETHTQHTHRQTGTTTTEKLQHTCWLFIYNRSHSRQLQSDLRSSFSLQTCLLIDLVCVLPNCMQNAKSFPKGQLSIQVNIGSNLSIMIRSVLEKKCIKNDSHLFFNTF